MTGRGVLSVAGRNACQQRVDCLHFAVPGFFHIRYVDVVHALLVAMVNACSKR